MVGARACLPSARKARSKVGKSAPPVVAISAAVVLADATTISLAAPAMSFKLTMGMPLNPPVQSVKCLCECECECVSFCDFDTQMSRCDLAGHCL